MSSFDETLRWGYATMLGVDTSDRALARTCAAGANRKRAKGVRLMTTGIFWPRSSLVFLLGRSLECPWFLVLPMLIVVPVSLTDRNYLSLPEHALSLRTTRAFLTNPIWICVDPAKPPHRRPLDRGLGRPRGALRDRVLASVERLVGGGETSHVGSADRPDRHPGPRHVSALGGLRVVRYLRRCRLAHTLTGIPYVVITVSASLAGFDVRLEQAARGLGASASTRFAWSSFPGSRQASSPAAFLHSSTRSMSW